jgi:hypothetical protein
MEGQEIFEIDHTLGATPFASTAGSRGTTSSSGMWEGKTMVGDEWVDNVPLHATDGGQLPPIYDPSWSTPSPNHLGGLSPGGLSPLEALHSSTPNSPLTLSPLAGTGGYTAAQLEGAEEKRPLIE